MHPGTDTVCTSDDVGVYSSTFTGAFTVPFQFDRTTRRFAELGWAEKNTGASVELAPVELVEFVLLELVELPANEGASKNAERAMEPRIVRKVML